MKKVINMTQNHGTLQPNFGLKYENYLQGMRLPTSIYSKKRLDPRKIKTTMQPHVDW
jgi:hypothetical protein